MEYQGREEKQGVRRESRRKGFIVDDLHLEAALCLSGTFYLLRVLRIGDEVTL